MEMPSTVCVPVPFFHVYGTVLGIVTGLDLGVTLAVPGVAFNKQEIIKVLSKHRCTAIYGTPTMYVDMCAAIKHEIEQNQDLKAGLMNIDVVVSGGAPCSPQLFTEISSTFNCTNVQSAYGMSEMSPITFTNTQNDTFEQRTGTIGYVADHLEVKVVDEKGEMVPFGCPGEVWFRGYSSMVCYWGDEEQTKETITPNGWLKSGDQLVLSEQGYGVIVGRIKEFINRGGEKIMPFEVEKILETHPSIQEVYVHPVSDRRMGEEVSACIKLVENKLLLEKDVKLFCQGKMARFKIPKYVTIMDEFPKTSSGKIKKRELRKIVEELLRI